MSRRYLREPLILLFLYLVPSSTVDKVDSLSALVDILRLVAAQISNLLPLTEVLRLVLGLDY